MWVRRLVVVTTVADTLGDFAGDIVRVRRLIGAVMAFVAEHSVGVQCLGAEATGIVCCGVGPDDFGSSVCSIDIAMSDACICKK